MGKKGDGFIPSTLGTRHFATNDTFSSQRLRATRTSDSVNRGEAKAPYSGLFWRSAAFFYHFVLDSYREKLAAYKSLTNAKKGTRAVTRASVTPSPIAKKRPESAPPPPSHRSFRSSSIFVFCSGNQSLRVIAVEAQSCCTSSDGKHAIISD